MRNRDTLCCALLLAGVFGCADAPTGKPVGEPRVQLQATKFWDALATTRWNLRATDLHQTLPPPPNGQAWASRMLTYLSLAQYRAALAATAPSNRRVHPSVSAAVDRASVTVLREFFAAHAGVPGALEQQLIADRSATPWPGEANRDVAAGDAIGLAVGRAVLEQSRNDGYLSLPALTPPTGAGFWIPSGNITRSLWGARPFFLEPADLLLAPAPPRFGNPDFTKAVEEVYAIVSTRTPAELAIALKWDRVPPNGPSTAGEWNRIADSLIQAHRTTELEAARLLAYANAAAFDAQIDCFLTKFTWWVARPSQADGRIAPFLAFAAPNHPSYPSSHSCVSSAFGAVLSDAFPGERRRLDALVSEAGMSRVYAGIHYRFDVEAGQDIGRRAAAKALAGSLEEH
jgi:membrane-associated phospholipid phosphatase